MTKGKIVLELLKYAKSAIKNFDQSEASIVVMWLWMEASDWSKFLIADLAYLSNSKTIHYESRPNRQAPTLKAVKGSDRNQSQ